METGTENVQEKESLKMVFGDLLHYLGNDLNDQNLNKQIREVGKFFIVAGQIIRYSDQPEEIYYADREFDYIDDITTSFGSEAKEMLTLFKDRQISIQVFINYLIKAQFRFFNNLNG